MAAERSSRKLAVILHADVAGSTALVQRDEATAHERIQAVFHRFAETIGAYNGITHELRGDALLAEFRRASDAISAALVFQGENTEHNKHLGDEIRPEIRIGISLGEVIIADGTLTGPDVVLAQRIEQLSQPGHICVSVAIQQAVPRRMPFDFQDLGEKEVKGFEEPVRVFSVALWAGEQVPAPESTNNRLETRTVHSNRHWFVGGAVTLLVVAGGLAAWLQPWSPALAPVSLVTEGSREPPLASVKIKEEARVPDADGQPLPDKPSIAVLPFTNMSGDPEQEYFSDGITEDLITDLSNISGLFIIARNSSFSFKGQQVKVRQIARELGVRYVLEGSVRRVGDQIRINAQLIDAATSGHIWAERYDGTLANVFALQDKVTRRIVAALKLKLAPQEQAMIAGHGTSNPAAYDTLLKGWALVLRKTPEDAARAIAYFEQALELDPNYGRAYAALAQTYWDYRKDETFNTRVISSTSDWGPSGFISYFNAWENLRKARSEISAQTHTLTARMLQSQRRFDEAMEEARQAVALGPSDPAAYDVLIENLIYAGKTEEALRLIDESIRLDPNLPGEKLFLKGMAYYVLGRLEGAVTTIIRARVHNPRQSRYAAIQAAALAELGRVEEAKMALEDYLSEWVIYPALNWAMFDWPFQHLEIAERLANGLTKAGMTAPLDRYYGVAAQERLTTDEIKSLLSNKTMIGADRSYYGTGGQQGLEVTRDKNAQIVSQGFVNYFRDGGKSRVEDDLLCDPWRDLGDYCVAIYRNSEGTQERYNEYVYFTLTSTFTFSVFDSAN